MKKMFTFALAVIMLCAAFSGVNAAYAADSGETTQAVSPCGFGGGASSSSGGGAEGEAAPQQGGIMGMMFPLLVFILIFYFFILRPQKKRDKQHNEMVSSIGRGDQIVTIGGFLGKVREVRDDTFIIDLGAGENEVRVCILKSAVQTKRGATAQKPAEEK